MGVGGIQSRAAAVCRLDLNDPPTAVGGILCALTHQVSDSISRGIWWLENRSTCDKAWRP